MATTTPAQGFPVMTNDDDPDIPADIMSLALAIEKRVMGVYNNVADRNTKVSSPQEGQVAFLKDDNSFTFYDGAQWTSMFTKPPTFTASSTIPSNATGENGDVHFKY